MENTQEDIIPDSTSLLRSLFEKELAKEKSRIRQRQYRLMRKQRESNLQQSYDQLKINFQTLEISLHVISQQSKMHEARAREYKQLCEILINQMAKKKTCRVKPCRVYWDRRMHNWERQQRDHTRSHHSVN